MVLWTELHTWKRKISYHRVDTLLSIQLLISDSLDHQAVIGQVNKVKLPTVKQYGPKPTVLILSEHNKRINKEKRLNPIREFI